MKVSVNEKKEINVNFYKIQTDCIAAKSAAEALNFYMNSYGFNEEDIYGDEDSSKEDTDKIIIHVMSEEQINTKCIRMFENSNKLTTPLKAFQKAYEEENTLPMIVFTQD